MILPRLGAPAIYAFIYSRQFFTAVDQFVMGMVLARTAIVHLSSIKLSRVKWLWIKAAGFLNLYAWCMLGDKFGIYTDNISGYVWHTGLALCLCILSAAFISPECFYEGRCSKVLLWLAQNEYGIYIWHFIVMENILRYSEFLQMCLVGRHYLIILFIQMAAAVITGSLLSAAIRLLTNELRKQLKRMKYSKCM